ncbi:MAG: DUF5916 domain-containing protein [Gemmatimonadota bacterium]|nr:DUF5916 domain-containing protein [Gemmatimonadota bacterium]
MRRFASAPFRTVRAALLFTCSLHAPPLHPQTPPAAPSPGPTVTIPRLTGPVELDGVVDEAAWDDIAPFPMTMYSPTFGGPLTETTEVRVGHDDRYLYVSGRMYDSEPDRIRTGTLYRDTYSGDDILGVVIDSYNDHETAVWFVTNPAGVRQDRTVSNDAQFTSGMPMNWDWNAYWDVATSKDGRGWFAEFRIPFSTLGFQAVDGEVTMGLIAYRMIPRRNERQTYPVMDPGWGRLGFARPSGAQRIVLTNVRQATPLYVTPYALGGFRQTTEPALPAEEPRTGWRTVRDPTTEAGLDIRYSPTSNLALDLSVNTDFAQVEADEQQVNLTRFRLFFPEKRQFFQERSSTFDFNTGGTFNRLFHSRRIGLSSGEPVRIYGGVRAVGRVAGTDFGLLTMQTAGQGEVSSENMGVLRLRQQVLNPNSAVGGMLTTRLGSHGADNVAYGLDAVLRLVGDEYLLVQWAHTFDEEAEQEEGLEPGLVRARLERRRDDGFSYYAEAIRVGSGYRPGLGFQSRRDFTYGAGRVGYRQYRGADSRLRSRRVSVETSHYHRNGDGTAESRQVAPELEFDFKGGTSLTIGVLSSFESVREAFAVADTWVLPGEHWFHQGTVMLRLPQSAVFRGEFNASAGSFYDGRRLSLDLGPVWTVSRHLEVEAGYEINRLDFPERDMGTTTRLARLRLKAALNPQVSMSTLVQYGSEVAQTSVNVRFRYHFREGTDLWIVYNEGLRHELGGLTPRPPRSAAREVMVKYSHAFVR